MKGTKRDAEKALAEAIHLRDTGLDVLPSKMTVGSYLLRWIRDYAATNVAASTFVRYESIVRKHLLPELGMVPLEDLRPAHIQAAYAHFLGGHGTADSERPLSVRTVLQHHRVLREALRHAVQWQLLSRNPADAVVPPRPEISELEILDTDAAQILLRSLAGTELYPLVFIALATAARQGELLGLKWSDLDLSTGVMRISRTLQRLAGRGVYIGQPKTHRSRRPIALSQSTIEVLRRHRQDQVATRLLEGAQYVDQDFVFATRLGQPLTADHVRRRFAKALSSIGLAKLRFHDLRHTSATMMLSAGVNPKIVSERLGHATVSITLDIYSHVLPDMQRAAAETLDGFLNTSNI